jgi:hypothetical protein
VPFDVDGDELALRLLFVGIEGAGGGGGGGGIGGSFRRSCLRLVDAAVSEEQDGVDEAEEVDEPEFAGEARDEPEKYDLLLADAGIGGGGGGGGG